MPTVTYVGLVTSLVLWPLVDLRCLGVGRRDYMIRSSGGLLLRVGSDNVQIDDAADKGAKGASRLVLEGSSGWLYHGPMALNEETHG